MEVRSEIGMGRGLVRKGKANKHKAGTKADKKKERVELRKERSVPRLGMRSTSGYPRRTGRFPRQRGQCPHEPRSGRRRRKGEGKLNSGMHRKGSQRTVRRKQRDKEGQRIYRP
jgi:hypothetical protein